MHKLTGCSPETTNDSSMRKRGGEREEPILDFPDLFEQETPCTDRYRAEEEPVLDRIVPMAI